MAHDEKFERRSTRAQVCVRYRRLAHHFVSDSFIEATGVSSYDPSRSPLRIRLKEKVKKKCNKQHGISLTMSFTLCTNADACP